MLLLVEAGGPWDKLRGVNFRNAEFFCFLVGELCFVKIFFLKFDGSFFFVSFEEKQHVGEICWVVFVWHISFIHCRHWLVGIIFRWDVC